MTGISNNNKSNSRTFDKYDKVILNHLISPLRFSGLSYLFKEGSIESSGPKESKKIRNRFDYLKSIQSEKPEEFEALCLHHKLDPSSVIVTESINNKATTKKTKQEVTMKLPNQFRMEHDHCVNVDQPELNKNQMLWFRDNSVGCDGKLMDILTIYKPLSDPRDYHLTTLSVSPNNKSLLVLQEPIIPTYMMEGKLIAAVHAQEIPVRSNGEIDHDHKHADSVKRVAQSHSVLANKLTKEKKTDSANVQARTNYKLQGFGLAISEGDFGNDALGGKLHPNLRTIPVSIPEIGKNVDVYYIYWKVVIDGDFDLIAPEVDKVETSNPFLDAQKRITQIGGNDSMFDSNQVNIDGNNDMEEEDDEEEEEEWAAPDGVQSAPNSKLAFLALETVENADDFSDVTGYDSIDNDEQKALAAVIAEGRQFFKEGEELLQEMDAEENPYKKRPRDNNGNKDDSSAKKSAISINPLNDSNAKPSAISINPLPDDDDNDLN